MFKKNRIRKFIIISMLLSLNSSIFLIGCSAKSDNLTKKKESEHFIFYTSEKDNEYLNDLEKSLESNYSTISKNLDVNLSKKVNVKIYPNIKDFHKAIGKENAEDWLVGVAINGEISMVSPMNPGSVHNYEGLMKVVIHEFAHVLVGEINGSTDIYLNEGLAVVEAKQIDSDINNYLKYTAMQNNLPAVSEMKNSFFSLEQPYFLTGGFLEFLINEYGYESVIEIIKKPNEIEAICNASNDVLAEKWKEYILNNK